MGGKSGSAGGCGKLIPRHRERQGQRSLLRRSLSGAFGFGQDRLPPVDHLEQLQLPVRVTVAERVEIIPVPPADREEHIPDAVPRGHGRRKALSSRRFRAGSHDPQRPVSRVGGVGKFGDDAVRLLPVARNRHPPADLIRPRRRRQCDAADQ